MLQLFRLYISFDKILEETKFQLQGRGKLGSGGQANQAPGGAVAFPLLIGALNPNQVVVGIKPWLIVEKAKTDSPID